MKHYLPLALILAVTSCTPNASRTGEESGTENQVAARRVGPVDTVYMHTGFYFLAEEGKGVRMRQERSNEVYTIAPVAFASVKNVKETKLEKTRLEDGDYTELCVTFDDTGTKDLQDGTGHPLHPKIACVVSNRLLYVVENSVSIRTGVMCVGLNGYTEEEMLDMQRSVDMKW